MSGQPDTDVSAEDRALASRYGGVSTGRRRAVLVGSVLLAAVFLGWLTWAIWLNSDPAVTSQLASFDIADDHHVTAVVQVHVADDATDVSCAVSALAADHSEVGEQTFTPDPSLGDQQRITITTDRRATAVESQGCTAAGQNRPR